jgi:hypothetical protein
MRLLPVTAMLFLLATAAGCARPFAPATPNNFVELDDQKAYDYRATSPEGVVMGVRAIDNDAEGTLSFWTQSVELSMRDKPGYELLEKKDVACLGGVKGTELRFSHDDGGDAHVYVVTVFVTKKRIYVLEAGGTKSDMDRYVESVDWSIRNFRPKS